MIVLDASAAVELVLNSEVGRRVAQEIAPPEISLNAPHLLDVEVTHVIRALVQRGAVPADEATQALIDYSQMGLERYGHADLLPRVWELRENLTAYDAVYVALAELLGATLLTCDARLASAAGHLARIHLLD